MDGKPLKQQPPPSSSSSGSSDKQVNVTSGGNKSAAASSSQNSSRQSQGKLVFGSNANRAPEKQKVLYISLSMLMFITLKNPLKNLLRISYLLVLAC